MMMMMNDQTNHRFVGASLTERNALLHYDINEDLWRKGVRVK